MSSTVALILRMRSAAAVEAIARCMPVWIADTPEHKVILGTLKEVQDLPPLTSFPLKDEETLEDAAVRIAFSLDDHYNEHARKLPYRFLVVYGVNYVESMMAELAQLDFSRFDATDFGFVAAK